jgi:hypothetical protein
LPLSPVQLLERAQKDLCLGPDLVGAFKLLPVALFVFARPFAVRPPPALTDNFSPLPTERLGDFFLAIILLLLNIFLLGQAFEFVEGYTSLAGYPIG